MPENAIHTLQGIEGRLARLDARKAAATVSKGQLGLDFGGAPAKGGGEACGESFIAPEKTCHKGKGGPAAAPAAEGKASGSVEEEISRIRDLQVAHEENANRSGHHPGTVGREVVAGLMAYKPGQDLNWSIYNQNHTIPAAELEGLSPRQISAAIYTKIKGKAPGRGQAFGDWFMAPGKEKAAAAAPAPAPPPAPAPGPTLQLEPPPEGGGKRFGARHKSPKAEEQLIGALDVFSGAEQLKFAKQQRAAAYRAGDKKGEKAWEELQRDIQRRRLAAAQEAQKAQQVGLFGVEEGLPLFGRHDAAPGDPMTNLLQQVLSEQLEGAQVLDWEVHPRGVTAGRVVAEGLVYRYRCDGEEVRYQPAWPGLNERTWEQRSAGFMSVRSPERMDFRGRQVRFEQKRSKRKCSIGYSCGRSCIEMSKECRVTPASAIGKQRLRQLQALAKEGDVTGQRLVDQVQKARDQQAAAVREERQTDQLRKLLKNPKVAEMVRTGKIPDGGGQEAGKVREVSPDEIAVDPERFQYKLAHSATGEVGSLSGVKKWDPNLAGVLAVWKDPADGRSYVVNGHNRLALARRLGAETVTVRYIDAANAKEARAIGAKVNIAEGAGKEVDAAKFFRDTGITSEDQIEAEGLPLKSGKAAKGLALAKLPEEIFNDVVQGNLKVGRAAILGGSGLDEVKQREIYKLIKARPSMADGTLQELVEQAFASEQQQQTTIDLFGESKVTEDNLLARAELANGLKRKLAREQRLFGVVSKARAAEQLQEKGGNVINREQSGQVADEAAQVLRVFNDLKNAGSGPVSNALNEAAARIEKGEKESEVRAELEEKVIQAVQEELERFGLGKRKGAPNEAPTASLFDSYARRLDALEERLDARRAKESPGQMSLFGAGTGQPCGESFISKDKTCRKGAGAAAPGEEGRAGRVAEQQRQIEEVKQAKREQDQRPLDPGEDPITEGDIEGMEQAREIMAGRLSPSAELEKRKQAKGGEGAAPEPKRLAGAELLAFVKENEGKPKGELVKAAGYVGKKADGSERIQFTDFYTALLAAKEQGPGQQAKAGDAPSPSAFASPSDLNGSLARQAHAGTSFEPEKRGRRHQEDFASHLNDVYASMQALAKTPAQQEILATEMAAFKAGYKARYEAWLHAHSRVVSTMIAGPSKFPVERMRKRNETEGKRLKELVEWDRKAISRVKAKIQSGLTGDDAVSEEVRRLQRSFARDIAVVKAIDTGESPYNRTAFTTSIAGKVTRAAERGEVEVVERVLDWLDIESRVMGKKPLFTPRHSIWNLRDTARTQRQKLQQQSDRGTEAGDENPHGTIERDFEANRIRLKLTAGKPSDAVRTLLKRSGWRWSPSNGAWQRMNTENTMYSAKEILRALEKEQAGRTDSDPIAALEARLDAKKNCTVGFSCGATCIPKTKQCRKGGSEAAAKVSAALAGGEGSKEAPAPAKAAARGLSLPEMRKEILRFFRVKSVAGLKKSKEFKHSTADDPNNPLQSDEDWRKLYRRFIRVPEDERNLPDGPTVIRGIDVTKNFRPWVVFDLDPKTATEADVRAAFRKLIMKHHPDHGGDPRTAERLQTMKDSLIATMRIAEEMAADVRKGGKRRDALSVLEARLARLGSPADSRAAAAGVSL